MYGAGNRRYLRVLCAWCHNYRSKRSDALNALPKHPQSRVTSQGRARFGFYSVYRGRQFIKLYNSGNARTCIAADIRRTLPACCICGKCILSLRHPAICRASGARFVCTAGSFSNFPPNNRYSGVVASSYPYLFKDFVKSG